MACRPIVNRRQMRIYQKKSHMFEMSDHGFENWTIVRFTEPTWTRNTTTSTQHAMSPMMLSLCWYQWWHASSNDNTNKNIQPKRIIYRCVQCTSLQLLQIQSQNCWHQQHWKWRHNASDASVMFLQYNRSPTKLNHALSTPDGAMGVSSQRLQSLARRAMRTAEAG